MEENNFNLEKKTSPLWKRTNFFISAIYLIFEAIIPGLTLFFLTSYDFTFSYKFPLWALFLLSLGLIIISWFLTFIIYKFKKHHLDQFTYVMPFVFFIIGFYITSYWLSYHYFLVRFIISIACSVVGILLTSIFLVLVMRTKVKKG